MARTPAKASASVYEPLANRLRAAIASGSYKPGDMIGSEYELAKQEGISRMSVRQAITLLVDEGHIERRPGKGLFVRDQQVTRVVQIIVPSLAYDQCVQFVHGAQEAGRARGIQLQVYDAHQQLDRDVEVIRSLPKLSTRGAIIASFHHERFAEALFELKREGYPFVLLDERLRDISVPSVLANNYEGGMIAGRKLLELGHRRIAFIGNLTADTVEQRLAGLRDAVADAGVPFDRSLTIDLGNQIRDDWYPVIHDATRSAVGRSDPATAVFYSNDQVAADGYRAIRALGLRIPEDVSVVGFDDNPLCRWLEPPLATVRQLSTQMGQVAMELLIKVMADAATPPEVRTLPVEWVQRESIARRA